MLPTSACSISEDFRFGSSERAAGQFFEQPPDYLSCALYVLSNCYVLILSNTLGYDVASGNIRVLCSSNIPPPFLPMPIGKGKVAESATLPTLPQPQHQPPTRRYRRFCKGVSAPVRARVCVRARTCNIERFRARWLHFRHGAPMTAVTATATSGTPALPGRHVAAVCVALVRADHGKNHDPAATTPDPCA
jgi:hypothetical protein